MLGKKKKYFADVDASDYLSKETVNKIIREQQKIERAMFTGTLDEVLHPNEQLSLSDVLPRYVKIHTFSVRSGYYEDEIEWNVENDAFISKWIDRETGCLYSLILFPNDEPENVSVTRDIFKKVYKYRYDDCEDVL